VRCDVDKSSINVGIAWVVIMLVIMGLAVLVGWLRK
jgi:hypothetical protein